MDTVSVIVLSALVNLLMTGLVGGVIIYRFQKDIDASYNKQMEEFKVNLQKISFEYQTKFVKNHEKMVETLGALYQKYSVFVAELGNAILLNKSSNKKETKPLRLGSPFVDELSQLQKYFNINKIYLSEESSSYIFDRIWKSNIIFFLIGVHGAGVATESLPEINRVTNESIDTYGLNIGKISSDKYDSEKIIDDMLDVLRGYSADIEKHYRIVSNIK